MADDTFLLVGRGVRYSPGVVFNTQMLPIIVDAAMTGLLVQHRQATFSALCATCVSTGLMSVRMSCRCLSGSTLHDERQHLHAHICLLLLWLLLLVSMHGGINQVVCIQY